MKALTTATLLLALATGPAAALTFDDLAGRWRGEGALSLNNEPAQRLRCQIRFRAIDAASTFLSGRCATAQAARSFTYMLIDEPGQAIRAENRMEPPDESAPTVMQGTLDSDGLRFSEPDAALFELRLTAEGLHLRLEGDGPQGFARGEALLHRAD